MDNLRKQSLNYYLSEYLEDLKRSGVRDVQEPDAEDLLPIPLRPAGAPQAQPPASGPHPSSAPTPSTSQPVPTPAVIRVDGSAAPQNNGLEIVSPPLVVPSRDRAAQLAALAAEVDRCRLCPKLSGRTHSVFGSGNPNAELCFIGEGPGAEEDLQGLPFVGRSGQLLTSMIEKGMGIPRSSVYICNIVRCRPPQNRNPEREEANACRKFLDATLNIVSPKYICCLGSIAATNFLNTDLPIGKLRGTVHEHLGMKVVCTYHPAYLLRNPSAKKQAWEDLQLLMREMGLPLPN